MLFQVRRLRRVEELMQFGCLLNKPEIPISYFQQGKCYGFFVDYVMVAGYCIVHEPLDDMLLIQQIPKKERGHLSHEDPFKYAEFTGYFLKDKRIASKFYRHIARKLLFHKASFFVYSYPASNSDVESFYRMGNPLRLYSGKYISVELISYIGIIKICLHKIFGKYL